MDRLSWTSPPNTNFSVSPRYNGFQQPLLKGRFDDAPLFNDRYDASQSCTAPTYDRKTMLTMAARDHQARAEMPDTGQIDLEPGKFGDALVQGKDLADGLLKTAKRDFNFSLSGKADLDFYKLFQPAHAETLRGALSGGHKALGLFGVLDGAQDIEGGLRELSKGHGEGALKVVTGGVSLGEGATDAMSLASVGTAVKASAKVGLGTGVKVAAKLGLGRVPLLGAAVSLMDGANDVLSYNREKNSGTVKPGSEAEAASKLKRNTGVAKLIGGGMQLAGVAAMGFPPAGLALIAAGTAVSIGADLVGNSKTVREVGAAGLKKGGEAFQSTVNFLASAPAKIGEKLSHATSGFNPLPGLYHRLAHSQH